MPIRCDTQEQGAIERIVLDAPKANLLDLETLEALIGHLATLRAREALKLVVLEGAGRHFSFGASVAEHLPDRVGNMLPRFHRLFRELEELSVPTAAIVRGQCLGGGAELATWCGHVIADPTARIGTPEIQLAVFPPIACIGFRWRMGGHAASALIMSGSILDATEARTAGLVDDVSDTPEDALRTWFDRLLRPRSAVALRHAWRATRLPLRNALALELPELERIYLSELMTHADPTEGLTAFIERREPTWRAHGTR